MTYAKKSPRIYKIFYRNGPNHRDGADVTFRDIVKIFGFRTATIGAWVTKEEQQIAANLFFDALCDLMIILQVPEKVISLNGTLSIAFGKGGQKYSSAHYDAKTRTLALAKNAGGGALSHEWFHSFDHFITSRFLQSTGQSMGHYEFASSLWLQNHQVKEHPLNRCLEDCYQHIFLKPNSDELSTLSARSAAADKAVNSYYYSRPEEICARAFEAFIQDQALKNEFLVQGTKQSTEAKLGIYPQEDQRMIISQYFLRYFSYLGSALENNPT